MKMDIKDHVPVNVQEAAQDGPQAPSEPLPSIAELALLDDITYDQIRKAVAKDLGVRVSTLDFEVHKLRPRTPAEKEDPFPEPQPWPEPVELANLLDEIVEAIQRHVILDKCSAIAIALYVVFTYCVDAVSCCAILGIESPEKRCGKTTLLDLLTHLVFRPTPAANISTATVYRLIEAIKPTLLLDEVDTFLKALQEMIGILNSGHTRATAFVWRVVEMNGNWEPQRFSTWAPKVIAQIGKLPDTLRDRSIIVSMRRKLAGEEVERLRKRDYSDIARKAYSWALENKYRIPELDPLIPECLNDREADSWEPMLALADLAGGAWPESARTAAKTLSGAESDTDSIRIQLLNDLREIFQKKNGIGLSTNDLLRKLCEFEDHPWSTYCKGHPINARQLAALLKPFGIKSKVEHKLGQVRGYMTEKFDDTFRRYLISETPVMPLEPYAINDIGENLSVKLRDDLTHEKPPKPLVYKESNGITHKLPSTRKKHINITPEINEGVDSWTF